MRFDPVECGKRMKALRESKNLTQMQLAEQLNISLNHVKALEHARRLFSIDLVIEISAFFDVSLDYLLLGKNTKHQQGCLRTERCDRNFRTHKERTVTRFS